jgi:hypothetical protein
MGALKTGRNFSKHFPTRAHASGFGHRALHDDDSSHVLSSGFQLFLLSMVLIRCLPRGSLGAVE